jgi:hypothetical protein
LHPSAFVHWHAETLIRLAGVFISQGLERADKWSSIAGFVGIVAFGVAGLAVSLRSHNETNTNRAVPPSATRKSRADVDAEGDPSVVEVGSSSDDKPLGGSIFHIDTDTGYTAHEMTIYNDRPERRKRQV